VTADTRVSLRWLLLPRGVSEARPRLNASGAAFRADAEVWFADDRTVDDYLARFRRNKVSGERPECPRAPKRASPAHICACCPGAAPVPGLLFAVGPLTGPI